MSAEIAKRLDAKGIFIAGTSGTRFTSRAIGDGIRAAYGPDAAFIPSAMSSDPPRGGAEGLAKRLEDLRGRVGHVITHTSAGAAQFGKAVEVLRTKNKLDVIAGITVVAMEVAPGRRNLIGGLSHAHNPDGKALDSMIAFPPDKSVMLKSRALEVVRSVLPGIKQEASGMATVRDTWQTDYSLDLPPEQREDLFALDQQIAAVSLGDTDEARRLLHQRGKMLRTPAQAIYHGKSPSQRLPDYEEFPRPMSMEAVRSTAKLLPDVLSSRPWTMLGDFQSAHDAEGGGPNVVIVYPEFAVMATPGQAKDVFGSAQRVTENGVLVEGLGLAGIALQPGVFTGIKSAVETINSR